MLARDVASRHCRSADRTRDLRENNGVRKSSSHEGARLPAIAVSTPPSSARNINSTRPSLSREPEVSSRSPAMRRPSTNVPFAERRSTTNHAVPFRSSVAWFADTLSSRIRTSLSAARPMVQTGRSIENDAPEYGPRTISRFATSGAPGRSDVPAAACSDLNRGERGAKPERAEGRHEIGRDGWYISEKTRSRDEELVRSVFDANDVRPASQTPFGNCTE